MVGVGVLAAVLNVAIVILITLSERAVDQIIRLFVKARLSHLYCAPVVHDSDTWLLNIPFSLIKFRHYPGTPQHILQL